MKKHSHGEKVSESSRKCKHGVETCQGGGEWNCGRDADGTGAEMRVMQGTAQCWVCEGVNCARNH